MDDCFKLLGVAATATLEQVKTAYRKLAETHHPDKGGSTEEFLQLADAYRQACRICEQPLVCPTCEGAGVTERCSGWRVAQIICTGCGGSGSIPRGQKRC